MSKAFKRFVARPDDEIAPAPRRAKRATAKPPRVRQTESVLVADITAYLRMLRWHVVVFSSYKPMASSIAGWPDIVAFCTDRVLLIECKAKSGALRESQVAFADAIRPHCGQHVRYIVARKIDDVMRVVESLMQEQQQ